MVDCAKSGLAIILSIRIFSLLILLILLLAAGMQIHETNIVAVTGNPVTICCGKNKLSPIRLWYFLGVTEKQEILIFNGIQG